MKITIDNYLEKTAGVDFTTLPAKVKDTFSDMHDLVLEIIGEGQPENFESLDKGSKDTLEMYFKQMGDYLSMLPVENQPAKTAPKKGSKSAKVKIKALPRPKYKMNQRFFSATDEELFITDMKYETPQGHWLYTIENPIDVDLELLEPDLTSRIEKAKKLVKLNKKAPKSQSLHKKIKELYKVGDKLYWHDTDGTLMTETITAISHSGEDLEYKVSVSPAMKNGTKDWQYLQHHITENIKSGEFGLNQKPAVQVASVSSSVRFIRRFVLFHGKQITRDQLSRYTKSLQKAITTRAIRKSDQHADLVKEIQTFCVSKLNKNDNGGAKDGASCFEFTISDEKLVIMREVGGSEVAATAVKFINKFISLYGKPLSPQMLSEAYVKLHHEFRAIVEKKLVRDTCPFHKEFHDIGRMLKRHSEDNRPIVMTDIELKGLAGICNCIDGAAPAKKKSTLNGVDEDNPFSLADSDRMPGQSTREEQRNIHPAHTPAIVREPVQNNSKVKGMNSTELQQMNFKVLGLKGAWRKLLGNVSTKFSMMIYGGPGSGKSTMSIMLAKLLASDYQRKVAYVAKEEGAGATLKDKFERLEAYHRNIDLYDDMPDDFTGYDFVVLDSVNELGLKPDDLRNLIAKWKERGVNFIFIFKATKNGWFRGPLDFEHLVDISIRVTDGEAFTEKSRYGGSGSMNIFYTQGANAIITPLKS